MKAIVIGSGLSGLTAALALAKAGWEVEIFEQAEAAGGVTQGFEDQGFRWDFGQLNVEAFGRDEPVGEVLHALGLDGKIKLVVDHREYIFPDFAIKTPPTYQGLTWRIEYLKQQFPEDAPGLERYWKDYVRFTRLMTLARRAENTKGASRLAAQAAMYLSLLPLLPKKDWTAEKLVAHYFKSEKLRAVFISILADFFTPPSQFMGLGVFALNPETAYEKRMPAHLAKDAEMVHLYSIQGGLRALVRAYLEEFQANKGILHTASPVNKIVVNQGRVTGIEDQFGRVHPADVVVASGGARETFCGLVGGENLPAGFGEKVTAIPLMDSIFMLHLGLDMDLSPYLNATSTYFYGTYDVEGEINRGRKGHYHEGAGGFVVHFPSRVSPEAAPQGKSAITIYTICPDQLAFGSWSAQKEAYADKLLGYAEQRLPGLRDHILVRHIFTPEEFRALTHLSHHAFGGIAPVMNAWRVPHKTPIQGLWFIGAQSESGGGVNNVITSSYKVAGLINENKLVAHTWATQKE